MIRIPLYFMVLLGPFLHTYVILDLGSGVPNVSILRLFILVFLPFIFIYNLLQHKTILGKFYISFLLLSAYFIIDFTLHGFKTGRMQSILDIYIIPALWLFVITNAIVHCKEKSFAKVTLLSGVLIAISGVAECILQRNIFGPEDIRTAGSFLRVNGPFEDGIVYATILLLFLPYCYFCINSKLIKKPYGILCFSLLTLGSMLQLSRACTIAMLVVFAILFFRKRASGYFVFIYFAILFSLVFSYFLVNTIKQTEIYSSRIAEQSNIVGRYERYVAMLKAFANHPAMGIGYGELSEKMNPHNSYLQNLVEIGALGTILWLLYLYSPLYQAFINLKKYLPDEAIAYKCALSTFCIILFVPMTVSVLHSIDMMLIYFLISACYSIQTNHFLEKEFA